MSEVQQLIKQIRLLTPQQQRQIRLKLMDLADEKYADVLSHARDWAKDNGITQQRVDEAVERRRYGKTPQNGAKKTRRR